MKIGLFTNQYPLVKDSDCFKLNQMLLSAHADFILIICDFKCRQPVQADRDHICFISTADEKSIAAVAEKAIEIIHVTEPNIFVSMYARKYNIPVVCTYPAADEHFHFYPVSLNSKELVDIYHRLLFDDHDFCEIRQVSLHKNMAEIEVLTNEMKICSRMISLDDYVQSSIRAGMKFSYQKLEQMEQHTKLEKKYQGCLRHIAIKDRSVFEMYTWLKQSSELSSNDIHVLIERLRQKDYLNDERLCMEQIQLLAASCYGSRQICAMLLKRGITESCVRLCMEQVQLHEEEYALSYAKKMVKADKASAVFKLKNKLRNKLMLRGYQSSVIDKVFHKLDFSAHDEMEQELLLHTVMKVKKRLVRKFSGTELKQRVYRYCLNHGFMSEDIRIIIDEMEWNDDKDQ